MAGSSRRKFMVLAGSIVLAPSVMSAERRGNAVSATDAAMLSPVERAKHERYMQEAIDQAAKNKQYPFGCVLVNINSGEIVARGVNNEGSNPILHGEIAAINNYAATHGRQGWEELALYTTGEPCSMCMSAIAWAGIPVVVWASSISTIRASGIGQIDISASEVASEAQQIYRPKKLIKGLMAKQMDAIFMQREK